MNNNRPPTSIKVDEKLIIYFAWPYNRIVHTILTSQLGAPVKLIQLIAVLWLQFLLSHSFI